MNAQFFKTREPEIAESLPITRENSFAGTSRRTKNSKQAEQAEKIERYARVNHHVLLTGERGTEKTTIARQIHDKGARRHKQFVSLTARRFKRNSSKPSFSVTKKERLQELTKQKPDFSRLETAARFFWTK